MSAGGRWLAVTLERPAAGERGSYDLDFGSDQVRFVWPIAASEAELSRVFRRCAREVLLGRLRDEANRLQLDLPRLTVRDQASRWGSCSARRSLSVNWRLLLLPPELQDYVLRHELAHLTEMNHSRRFWELLERYDPERARHEKELDRLTPEIMRVGR